MAGDWKTVPLESLYDFGSGLSKPREEFGFGHGFLSFKDVFHNYFVPAALSQLVNSTEKEQQACSIIRGDVFLTRTSETMDELGMSCVALKDYGGATFNGFTKRLRPKSTSKIVPEYAGYYFRSPKFRRDVTAMSSLSTRASLNNEMLARLTIDLPPIDVQATIGSILKSLDDKIELNRRMNATLEAIARALFQSWFVDFDPVRAKLDGRQPIGLDEATAALFPATFQDSDAGHIPKEWAIKPVGEVVDCVGGGTPSTAEPKYWEGGTHHWTTPKDFSSLQAPVLLDTARKLTDAGIAKISSGLLPAGTLLLSSRAPVGYHTRISRVKALPESAMPLIAIVVDIAYRNPRTYAICAAILSKLLSFVEIDAERLSIAKRIKKKFSQIPNTGHMQIWLQRVTLQLGNGIAYDEAICKLVAGEDVSLWNIDWISSATLKAAVAASNIVDATTRDEIAPVIPPEEIELFLSKVAEGYY